MPTTDLFSRVKKSRTFRHLIRRFALDHKRVLDVGSSEGHYLQCFGPGSLGVTIIPAHIEAARARGLEVVMKNVEDPAFTAGGGFDVVWANNFFEHMNAPHLFLTAMRQELKPNGLLILGVPVIPYFSWLMIFRQFRGSYASSHVNFFTRRTLIATVRAAGWHVRAARPFYFQMAGLDLFGNLIAPHIYVVAESDLNFKYSRKRSLSLAGY